MAKVLAAGIPVAILFRHPNHPNAGSGRLDQHTDVESVEQLLLDREDGEERGSKAMPQLRKNDSGEKTELRGPQADPPPRLQREGGTKEEPASGEELRTG